MIAPKTFRYLSVSAVILMAGCAVGPDFHRPTAPQAAGFSPDPQNFGAGRSTETQAGSPQLILDRDIPGDWWSLFHCDALNELIKAAIAANPDLKAAQAALRNAWEDVYAQRGFYWPTVSANYSANRERMAAPLASIVSSGDYVFDLHTAQVSVSYVPDVFGANKRQVESLVAQAEVQQFQLEATYLTLTSNLVVAAVQTAALRAEVAATSVIIDDETKILASMRRQLTLGQLAESDIATQETLLAQSEASLPPLQKQLEQQRDLIRALMGRWPNQETGPEIELDSLELPTEIPLSLPSKLVDQRPDIRAAEAQLHAASAQLGVAIANRLPNLQIDAAAGSSATAFSQLIAQGTHFWSLTGSITQPLFTGGTLLHRQRAAEAALEQAAAQYQSTMITAFQNVADTLYALQTDEHAMQATLKAQRAAGRSLQIVRRQLELGDTSYVNVLIAEQNYELSTVSFLQAQANHLEDCAALFQALGGGWWNRPERATAAQQARTSR
jgi:NodT family efflux transporter outer membrane factor (OMF) lipoprotein